jgi:hypothetical protein
MLLIMPTICFAYPQINMSDKYVGVNYTYFTDYYVNITSYEFKDNGTVDINILIKDKLEGATTLMGINVDEDHMQSKILVAVVTRRGEQPQTVTGDGFYHQFGKDSTIMRALNIVKKYEKENEQ